MIIFTPLAHRLYAWIKKECYNMASCLSIMKPFVNEMDPKKEELILSFGEKQNDLLIDENYSHENDVWWSM